MPKSLPKPLRKQREVLYLPVTGHSAVLGTAGRCEDEVPASHHAARWQHQNGCGPEKEINYEF